MTDPRPAGKAGGYTDALLPCGIVGTFVPMVLGLLLGSFAVVQVAGPEKMFLFFLPAFLCVFFGPVIYNTRPSHFERGRVLIASFTGGGAVFPFHGGWPFFRLMVYRDALEIRVMFHRFLIPFDLMQPISESAGFFSGVLIRSDLPGVPGCIRFRGFGMKRIVTTLHETQRACLAAARRERL